MRLYLATLVLQLFLFDGLGIPYWVTAVTTVLLIWVYTFRGGIKTIVYTDTFQTLFLVSAVVMSVVIISQSLNLGISELYGSITSTLNVHGESMSKVFFLDDFRSPLFFPKQFFGGMFLAITMTGLDQDLMQKNLTCRSIGDAQKNMYSFTAVLVVVTFLFLILGGALYVYAAQTGVALPVDETGKIITDKVFPSLAFGEFGTLAGVFFLLGITASTYASSDSALAALTTGFCIDFLNFSKRDEKDKKRIKLVVHIGFSLLFLIIILVMKQVASKDLISMVLTVAAYTYGPLLGLFFFGIITKRKLRDALVPVVCIISPVICYMLARNSAQWFGGYVFGYEMLILNGAITFIGLWLISFKNPLKSVSE